MKTTWTHLQVYTNTYIALKLLSPVTDARAPHVIFFPSCFQPHLPPSMASRGGTQPGGRQRTSKLVELCTGHSLSSSTQAASSAHCPSCELPGRAPLGPRAPRSVSAPPPVARPHVAGLELLLREICTPSGPCTSSACSVRRLGRELHADRSPACRTGAVVAAHPCAPCSSSRLPACCCSAAAAACH